MHPLLLSLLIATSSAGLTTPEGAHIDAVEVTDRATAKPSKAQTPEGVLLEGLRLIADGDFDAWVARYCHKDKLCPTAQAIKSVKRYNLPAVQRIVPGCLAREKKGALEITRRDRQGDELKLFVQCSDKGMPRPFTLRKEGDAWMFRRI